MQPCPVFQCTAITVMAVCVDRSFIPLSSWESTAASVKVSYCMCLDPAERSGFLVEFKEVHWVDHAFS